MNAPALDCRLSELDDPDLRGLLAELDHVTGLQYRQSAGLTLMQYLVLSIFPGGDGKKRPLDSKRAVPGFLLTRLDKISSEAIQRLCEDLASRSGEGIEMHANGRLLPFLNKILRELTAPRKKRRR